LEHSPGIWVQTEQEYKIIDLQGKTLHSFQCTSCILSPDEKLLIVNQEVPVRVTRLVELATGKERWQSSAVSGHIWSPSMRWIFGTVSSQEAVVVDALSGRIVARWFSPSGRGAVWFGDVLVETDPSRAAIWKPGARTPLVEKSLSAPDIVESPTGERFLAANAIWTMGGKLLFRLEGGEGCEVGYWNADNLYLSGYCNDGITVWDAKTGKVVSRLIAQTTFRHGMSWSRGGHQLLLQGEDRRLIRHTPHGATVIVTPRIDNGQVAFSTAELTGVDDGKVRIIELPASSLNGWDPPP
jgi:WD40 repeat protein